MPSGTSAVKLSKILDVQVDWLLVGSSKKNTLLDSKTETKGENIYREKYEEKCEEHNSLQKEFISLQNRMLDMQK